MIKFEEMRQGSTGHANDMTQVRTDAAELKKILNMNTSQYVFFFISYLSLAPKHQGQAC